MPMELLQKERQSQIFDLLGRKGRVLAGDLASQFGVSEDTIRRDLREMAAAGRCERVYGGALAVTTLRQPLSARLTLATERKADLARCAIACFRPGMTIFIDAGSTNLAIARALPEDMSLTVVTNAPAIAMTLMDRQGVDIIMIGGSLDRHVGANLGARTLDALASLIPDMTVIGACGLDPSVGITASLFEDAEIKRLAAANSRSVMAAVTNEKFSLHYPHVVCGREKISCLVVENDAPEDMTRSFSALGIPVHRAGQA